MDMTEKTTQPIDDFTKGLDLSDEGGFATEEEKALLAQIDGPDEDDENFDEVEDDAETVSEDALDEIIDDAEQEELSDGEVDTKAADAAVVIEDTVSAVIPEITVEPVANLKEQLEALDEERMALRLKQADDESALKEKVELGELDEAAHRKAMAKLRVLADSEAEALNDKKSALKGQDREYRAQVESVNAAYVRAYKAELKTFLAVAKAQGVDYEDPAKPRLTKAMDAEIRTVAEANPTWGNRQCFEVAHKNIVDEFGLVVTKASKAKARDTPIPRTLGKLPIAARNHGDVKASSDAMNRLTGEPLERALAAMTEDQVYEYLGR
jgi:hypothetical protein